jgi:DNA-binding XRE family transcriptional regulator
LRFESQTGKPMPISYPENPVSIGDHIRKKRMELKLLQKDVARICGVTEDCITNWEKNRSVPQVQFFPQIIKFLDYLPFDVDLTTLRGKLKAYRHKNGFSQKQMGKILKVDGGTVCSWELGENQPHKKMLEKLDAMLQGIEY